MNLKHKMAMKRNGHNAPVLRPPFCKNVQFRYKSELFSKLYVSLFVESRREAAAAAKAEADKVEALVQVRLKQLQAEADSAPDATATSTSGPVVG